MKALVKRAKVLLYTPEQENQQIYKKIFEDAGLAVRELRPQDFGTRTADLAAGKTDNTGTSFSPDQAFAVFCFCTSSQLDRILRALRAPGVPPLPLKASMTPTNATWTLQKLYEEVSSEHQLMHEQA